MKRSQKIALAALRIGVAMALTIAKAHAQSADSSAPGSSSLAEVVISAEKRLSTVQDTPESVEAVSGEDLQAAGVPSLATLAQGTPGVSFKSEGPSQTEIEMRGMTSSGGNLRI